jgi:hypothetical protein
MNYAVLIKQLREKMILSQIEFVGRYIFFGNTDLIVDVENQKNLEVWHEEWDVRETQNN